MSHANCQANPDCTGYLNCILPCSMVQADAGSPEGGSADAGVGDDGAAALSGPAACEAACAQQFPTGRRDWAPLSACVIVECGGQSQCDGSETPCLQCITQQCAQEYVDYVGTADGVALAFCIDSCAPTDVNCETVCYEQFPDVLPVVSAVDQCALQMCAACQAP